MYTKYCYYKCFGCPSTFYFPHTYKHHYLRCKFGFTRTCQEPDCVGRPCSKFDEFEKLILHSSERHQCVKAIDYGNGKFEVYVNLPKDFFELDNEEMKVRYYGRHEWEEEGETYKVAIAFIAQKDASDEGNPKLHLLPIMYRNKDETCADLIKMDFSLFHPSGRRVRAEGSNGTTEVIPDESYCYDIHQIPTIIRDLTNGRLLHFTKEEVIQLSTGGVPGPYNLILKMQLRTNAYRCKSFVQSGIVMKPYASSWDDLGLSSEVHASGNSPDFLTRILAPQLDHDADVFLECGDSTGIFNVTSSVFMQKALKVPKTKGEVRQVVGIVLYPRRSFLEWKMQNWISKGEKLGVVVRSVKRNNESEKMSLKTQGCDILLTTPYVLNELLNSGGSLLINALVPKLKFVVLFDADHALEDDFLNSYNNSLSRIPAKIKNKLRNVIISPYVNWKMVNEFYTRALPNTCNILSLGRKPNFALEKLQMDVRTFENDTQKIRPIIDIIANRDAGAGRWVICVVEEPEKCPSHFDALVYCLSDFFGGDRVSGAKNESVTFFDPNRFDSFKENDNGILITSYFALKHGVFEISSGLILHSLPTLKGDLVRVEELFLPGQPGTTKTCYAFQDKNISMLDFSDMFE